MTEFNSPVKNLPPSVTSLEFGYDFDSELKLPPSLTSLKTRDHNISPTLSEIPSTLKELKCHIYGDDLNKLPLSIEDIGIVYDCTDPLIHCIPTSVRRLEVEDNFNFNLSCIPPSSLLTHLSFRSIHSIGIIYIPMHNLPSTLTHLSFGNYFNQAASNLPSTLTHLSFGTKFNRSVDSLPRSLTHIKFGKRFQTPWNNLPPVSHLSFDHASLLSPLHILTQYKFPTSVTHFEYGNDEDCEEIRDDKSDGGHEIPSLEYLRFILNISTPQPQNLQKLNFQKQKQVTFIFYSYDTKVRVKLTVNFETKEIAMYSIMQYY